MTLIDQSTFGCDVRLSERRVTFQRANYIQHHGEHIARLDDIFIHKILPGQKKLFVMITKVTGDVDESPLDSVLQLPLLQLSKETIIVGLPAVNGNHVYFLPVTPDGLRLRAGGRKLFFVNWQIKYL